MTPSITEELMMRFFDESEEMFIFLDQSNKIIKMNKSAASMLAEHDNLEQISNSLCSFCTGYTSEKEMMTCLNCFIQNRKNQESFQIFMKNKHGEINPYSASYLMLSGDEGIKVLTLQNISQQFRTQEILHQKTITQKIINAQENERKRISRELHDSVVQEILNVMVDFRLLKYKKDEDMKKHVQLMEGSMSRLMDDIRNLSLELRPSSLDDLGLEAACRSHFKQLEKNHGLDVEFISNISSSRYDTEIETAVYRIIQEALFNIVKYAEVDQAMVTIDSDLERLRIRIKDEGIGFSAAEPAKGTGLGLFGMRERAEIVDGQVEINSIEGVGTTVDVIVPVGRNL